jgi:hypothetical protein
MGRAPLLVLVLLLCGALSCRSPATEPQACEPPAAVAECDQDLCTRFGLEGVCVKGTCVLGGGACTRDLDCDDGNPCTAEVCEEGRCAGGNRAGTCEAADGAAGVCVQGRCEAALPPACLSDEDCGASLDGCAERGCVESRCVVGALQDGLDCEDASGRWGACAAGRCSVAGDGEPRRCQRVWRHGDGWSQDCRTALLRTLPPEEVTRAEQRIEARLADTLRYDMKASLVALHTGGYNIVLHNKRDRDEVRGLCDPSFVAFELASYTAATRWRSQDLHIWLSPYEEGWALPTSGSRVAVARGKASSPLGVFGVVEIKPFRTWLEKSFRPLKPGPRLQELPAQLEVAVDLPPLPTAVPPDAGAAMPAATAEAPVPVPAAATAAKELGPAALLKQAWELYAQGRTAEAKKALARARRGGMGDSDLELLLEVE